MTKWIATLVLVACAQVNAAQFFTPEKNPDTGTPTIALKVNNQTGQVFIHTKGKWVAARMANNPQDMMEPANYVESADSSVFDYFWNFYYGSYYNYWSYYPSNYYYYQPNSYLYYNNYSYSPYYYDYNNNGWSYYSYRW